MSIWLGDESRQLAIFGEGNTSAKISDESFFVKASGCELGSLTESQVVEVRSAGIVEMLREGEYSGLDMQAGLRRAMAVRSGKLLPSVETLLHAYLLSLPGVNFVGHTHPVAVNAILCSKGWKTATEKRLMPEEIVCCGIEPAYVEYTNPGVDLARALRSSVEEYTARLGVRPKVILLQNHGMVALGATPKEVQSITGLWDKTARVLAGTYSFGGPNYLSDEAACRFACIPDDDQRLKLIQGLM
ncbi:MAG TPA: class II aldolase/adducin family protein [Armatimonadota bacterium]